MKRNYITPEASIYDTRLRMSVLVTGSVTDVKMKINSVTVQDYEAGFDIGVEHDDFKNISFE